MPHLFSAKMLRKEAHEITGYFMRHKTGFDVAFSWNKDDPNFSDEWERIPAVAQLAPASTGRDLGLFEKVAFLAGWFKQGGISDDAFLERLEALLAVPVAARELDVEAERLLRAAKVYAFNYMQDEAEDEEDCVCGPKQHAEAKEVFEAIRGFEEARASRSAAQGTAPAPTSANKVSKRLRDLAAGRIGREIPALEYDAAADEIDRLAAYGTAPESAPVSTEQAGDARDAARYRHIKADNHRCADNTFCLYLDLDGNLLPVASADMDAEIDAAMLEAAPSPNNSPVGADRRE